MTLCVGDIVTYRSGTSPVRIEKILNYWTSGARQRRRRQFAKGTYLSGVYTFQDWVPASDFNKFEAEEPALPSVAASPRDWLDEAFSLAQCPEEALAVFTVKTMLARKYDQSSSPQKPTVLPVS